MLTSNLLQVACLLARPLAQTAVPQLQQHVMTHHLQLRLHQQPIIANRMQLPVTLVGRQMLALFFFLPFFFFFFFCTWADGTAASYAKEASPCYRTQLLCCACLFPEGCVMTRGLACSGGGLGGGSANAATTLWAANELAGQPASNAQLLQWSGEIGSDISVFFSQGAAYCTGR